MGVDHKLPLELFIAGSGLLCNKIGKNKHRD